MEEWLRTLVESVQFASFGSAGIATGAVLVILLRILLPAQERRRVRLPLLFLLGNVSIAAFRSFVALPDAADKVLGIIGLVLIIACIGQSVFVLVVDWLLERRLRRPMPKIFRDVLQVLVYVGVAFLTLPLIGLEPGDVLTTSALLTAVVGLSMQETLGNLFAGLAIQAQQPFQVGDWIKFDQDEKLTGRVTEINWRATKVMTNDLVEIIVPNGTLAKVAIENYTQPTRVSRRTIMVQGPYEAPPHTVIAALLDATRECPEVLADPVPEVQLRGYGDSGMNYALRFCIDDYSRRMQIDTAVAVRVWYSFQRAGITIPFPIRDVRARDMTAENRDVAGVRIAERRRALTSIDFLAGLSDPVLEKIAERTDLVLYSDGEQVIRQGDAGSELFIVRRGEVVVLVGPDPRRATQVATLGPGKFFGEMSLMTGENRTATVAARGPCELFVLGHDEMREILEVHPDLAQHFAEVLGRRQAQLDERSTSTAKREIQAAQTNVLLQRIRSFFSL